MTKRRPEDPAWIELRGPDYDGIWDQIYDTLGFHPSMRPDDWPSFREPADSITWDISPLMDDRSNAFPNAEADASLALRDALTTVVEAGDYVCALDWQHTCYRFRPDQASARPETWRVAALPDGDYFLFVDHQLRFGWLTHPWEQTICVFGDLVEAIRPFMDSQRWPVLRAGGARQRDRAHESAGTARDHVDGRTDREER